MFGKLAFRNVRRSAKDYLVYVLTMMLVTAFMFSFNTVLFSNVADDRELFAVMASMLGLATFFIVIIVAWLINYMVRFMLEKRSQEFGIYLLIGMKKKKISRLYMRENLLLGTGAFAIGLVFGALLQQVLMAILYSLIQVEYKVKIYLDWRCLLMTAGCYFGCYLLALLRCKRRFKKMNIHNLMYARKENEKIKETHEKVKRFILPLSLVFLLAFGVWLFGGYINDSAEIIAFLVGLILTIYLFYVGLTAWIAWYMEKKGTKIYHGQNLFLLRQFYSKMKTMRFTMGTLTSLFTIAFLGCTVAMMFNDYQNQILEDKFPFDVQVYSEDAKDNFADEQKVLRENAKVKDWFSYQIYENETRDVNTWLYTHLRIFGDQYKNEDGTVNKKKLEKEYKTHELGVYCSYDTYIGLSDYNRLREMLGYSPISLAEDEYALHLKERIRREAGDFTKEMKIYGDKEKEPLTFQGAYTEPFSQDGHNGADYLIIVPDKALLGMKPYYAEMVADLKGEAPEKLVDKLDALSGSHDFAGHTMQNGNQGYGSDTVVVYNDANLVRDNLIPEVKYMLSSLTFPAFYIGLVFLCVALTVLSVQQLSDSAKYKFRYDVLYKMGLSRKETDRVILKQLFGYYMCPALFAAVISGIIAIYVSEKFIFYTGVKSPVFGYFCIAFTMFFGIYAIYFIATYVGFRRNVAVGKDKILYSS